MLNSFYSVLHSSETMIEIEKSKFISYVKPVETEQEATDFINSIKKKHYDATHNVSAFYLRENSFYKRSSDDGEPSGTAGMPALQTMVNRGIIDVCVVITRYFGGTKLGTGGLVRAYTESTNKGLDNAKVIEFHKMKEYILTLSYDLLSSIQYHLKKKDILVLDTIYEENIKIHILLKESETDILTDLINLTSSQIIIEEGEQKYIAQEDGKVIASKEVTER